jgi:Flp pilus assembly protein TadD
MQDRVYAHVRAGRQAQAIRELEAWVLRRPNDEEALLWLARLLGEAGRADEAAARYRALLSRERGGR